MAGKKIQMQMAKASDVDIEAAMAISNALDAMERGWQPGDGEGDFDVDDPASCQLAVRHLLATARRGSLMRVVWGMATLIDPKNRIVDPDASVLQLHPRFAAIPET